MPHKHRRRDSNQHDRRQVTRTSDDTFSRFVKPRWQTSVTTDNNSCDHRSGQCYRGTLLMLSWTRLTRNTPDCSSFRVQRIPEHDPHLLQITQRDKAHDTASEPTKTRPVCHVTLLERHSHPTPNSSGKDRGLLRASAVTRGWNRHPNKSQRTNLTLEKKILPPLQPGFELATFRSGVQRFIIKLPRLPVCNAVSLETGVCHVTSSEMVCHVTSSEMIRHVTLPEAHMTQGRAIKIDLSSDTRHSINTGI